MDATELYAMYKSKLAALYSEYPKRNYSQ